MFIPRWRVLLFSYKILQTSVQRFAAKGAVDDLTLRVDEDDLVHLAVGVGHLQVSVLLADEGHLRTVLRLQQRFHIVSR